MEKITDYIALWRQLTEVRRDPHAPEPGEQAPAEKDAWRERARGFHKRVQERWARPDSSRTWVLSQVDADTTVLDIGAGTGSWTLLLAKQAGHVTALDPSRAMLEVLQENLAEAGLQNVSVVYGGWPDTQVEPHDLVLCAHAMYGIPDFPHFVHRLQEVARRRICLLVRMPVPEGVMGAAAMRVWGQPHDSANGTVAYGALVQMGIFPDVLMEDTGTWGAWKSPTLEDALLECKAKLGLHGPSEHDQWLQGLLAERLTWDGSQYVWPASMRSALLTWAV
ncbi:MAG: class I SAM-dependent methyltransferase [Anaerolineae bacterium]|jgi:SAM-dependent methyltransferase|nr:methyltransferase domain-containing protein [Chloroflexota bacterium]